VFVKVGANVEVVVLVGVRVEEKRRLPIPRTPQHNGTNPNRERIRIIDFGFTILRSPNICLPPKSV